MRPRNSTLLVSKMHLSGFRYSLFFWRIWRTQSTTFFYGLGEDKNVVHVNGYHAFFNEFSKKVIHHRLKGCRAVAEAEEHHQRFIEAPICSESCLPFISFTDADIVITPSNIKLSEVSCSCYTGHNIRNQRKWVSIPNGD